jgi:hypothetical protein
LNHSFFLKGAALTACALSPLSLAATNVKGEAHATILNPMEFKPGNTLHFGSIVIMDKNHDGIVNIRTNSKHDAKNVKEGQGSTRRHATFTLKAPADANYSLTVQDKFVITRKTKKLGSTLKTPLNVTVTHLTVDGTDVPLGKSSTTTVLKAIKDKVHDIALGADLEVVKNAPAGEYSGDYFIELNYHS